MNAVEKQSILETSNNFAEIDTDTCNNEEFSETSLKMSDKFIIINSPEVILKNNNCIRNLFKTTELNSVSSETLNDNLSITTPLEHKSETKHVQIKQTEQDMLSIDKYTKPALMKLACELGIKDVQHMDKKTLYDAIKQKK